MPPEVRGFIGVTLFLAVYGLILWGALRWAQSRLSKRAQRAADALVAAGARVLAVRPSPGYRRPAEVDFELDGKRARFDVRHWGRDWILCSVRVDSPPLPAMLVRPEGVGDRVGKSLGFLREVQVGDADFDAAAFISAAASDEQVRAVLAPAEVRRRAREVLQLGYSVEMSREGLRATTLQYTLKEFDGAPVPAVMRALEALVKALPKVDPSTLTQPSLSMMSLPAVIGLFAAGISFAALLILAPVLHAPMNDTDTLNAMGIGLGVCLVVAVVVLRALRDRMRNMVEVFLVALAMLIGVPSLTTVGLFAANSGLDHSAAITHTAQVQLRQRRDSELYVTGWEPSRQRQKVGVPRAIWRAAQVGDFVEIDTHPGALGWPWVSDVRRAP